MLHAKCLPICLSLNFLIRTAKGDGAVFLFIKNYKKGLLYVIIRTSSLVLLEMRALESILDTRFLTE